MGGSWRPFLEGMEARYPVLFGKFSAAANRQGETVARNIVVVVVVVVVAVAAAAAVVVLLLCVVVVVVVDVCLLHL